MSGLYLLDTDICAFVLRRTSDTLLGRIQAVPLAQQAISVVTYAELLYGVQVSSKKESQPGCSGCVDPAPSRSGLVA
jgi:tRNA(fMet)-specific endonuclease VapC